MINNNSCTSDNFNLEQMSSVQNINYRDWRSTGTSSTSSSSDVNKDDPESQHNKKHKNKMNLTLQKSCQLLYPPANHLNK